jgi:hypothetical protein
MSLLAKVNDLREDGSASASAKKRGVGLGIGYRGSVERKGESQGTKVGWSPEVGRRF